ncbi:MAG TPA: hybrid sensor histidine kinase/response regulator [Oscillatoriales cyanobacterium M59_W2019_021]|nr:MAG: hybrid sensor histidine kinase/response regulator [Cyanobacteria bacterium J055]HIK32065.1 hybrid sensor histidine kinase/response regulator [Oscillatoriales cyanobacterium M4454_W2019_049]HIK49681.1 hybrid sensor histidine kinase/response regulator [Oscillatoriales cyanobacterium M59_W2019_021]
MIRHPTDVPQGNLLLVDNTPKSQRLLSTALSESGYKVRTEINGSMALVGATATSPDLILLDLNLPDMSGYEFCQKLKKDERTRAIPVIIIGERDEVRDRLQALSAGGADYIIKPFQIEEVLARVETHVRLRRQEAQLDAHNNYIQQLSVQLAEQNVRLQQEISYRRAAELAERETAEQLTSTQQQLQQIQSQLAHSDRMSALGNLVVSVAHALNYPVNLIYGNLQYALDRTQTLLNVLEAYRQASLQIPPELEEEAESIDVDLLRAELPDLMNSMKVQTESISSLAQSLKNFSGLNAERLEPIDVGECLDLVVASLQPRLMSTQPDRRSIRIFKEYGQLPPISCNPWQIQQAFFQILLNAIEALEQPGDNQPIPMPMVTLETEKIGDRLVKIIITDNGAGMSDEVKDRIFEPFFTTKENREEHGLGLAISYAIVVHQHQGQLHCISSPGRGTSVVVELPINPPLG